MNIREYISQKFASFGVSLSEADFADLSMSITLTEEFSVSNEEIVNKSMLALIPALIARPNVSESGFSMTYDKQGLRDFYSMKCRQYGLRNELAPRVTFL